MTITKSDIITQIHTTTAISKHKYIQATEATLEIIKSTLESSQDIMISGFGKFEVKEKNPRKSRNPQTGSDLILDARRVVTFKSSGVLREKLNGSIHSISSRVNPGTPYLSLGWCIPELSKVSLEFLELAPRIFGPIHRPLPTLEE